MCGVCVLRETETETSVNMGMAFWHLHKQPHSTLALAPPGLPPLPFDLLLDLPIPSPLGEDADVDADAPWSCASATLRTDRSAFASAASASWLPYLCVIEQVVNRIKRGGRVCITSRIHTSAYLWRRLANMHAAPGREVSEVEARSVPSGHQRHELVAQCVQ